MEYISNRTVCLELRAAGMGGYWRRHKGVSFIVSLRTDVLRDVAVDTGFGTYSIDQNPSWEANLSSASQEIPPILWNLKVHYGIYKRTLPDPILRQINPSHTCLSHLLKI